MGRPGLGGACLLAAVLAAGTPALAAPKPAQLTATFKDRDAPSAKPSGCTVNFAEIVDERRSPELVGVIERRAVRAPADVQAWMRAVLGGLAARGLNVRFDPAAAPGATPARFTLQTAWMQSTVSTYSASVVVRLQAGGEAGGAIDKSYRGRVARTSYWSGGTATLQSAVDGAFADALDRMAVDLKTLCRLSPAGVETGPHARSTKLSYVVVGPEVQITAIVGRGDIETALDD